MSQTPTQSKLEQAYNGNPRLKRANAKHNYTPEEIQEFVKCSEDLIYFVRTYVKIEHVDHGMIPFDLYDYQEKILESTRDNRFSIFTLPRQCGKTATLVQGYLLWYLLFNETKTVGILSNKGATSREIMRRLQLSYQGLPKFLQHGVVEFNKGSFTLDNGSRALAFATSDDAVRGYSFSLIYIDECAFVPKNIWDDFYLSVYPTITSGKESKVILVSTPNGMNHFYKFWVDSQYKRNSYVGISATWRDVPGRDEAWKEEEIKNLGSKEAFLQEHECQFLGSSATLIPNAVLQTIPFFPPIESIEGLDIYEQPIPNHVYISIVDVAEGLEKDYSCFVILDISEIPYKVVAKYQSNKISEFDFPEVIHTAAVRFNEAYILIEINKGTSISYILVEEIEYENVLYCSMKGRTGQVFGDFGNSSFPGVKTTLMVKKMGCSLLKQMIENQKIILNDYDILSQIATFVKNSSGSYSGEAGYHDDLVMCLVIFGWISNQEYFKDLTDTDIRKSLMKKKDEQMKEELSPFGFINDGKAETDWDDDGRGMFSF